MIPLVIILILVIGFLVLLLLNGGANSQFRKQAGGFFLTLSATFVGVFAAAQLTISIEDAESRQVFGNVVRHAIAEINSVKQNVDDVIELQKIGIISLDQNMPLYPVTVEPLMVNQLFSSYASVALPHYVQEIQNLRKVRDQLLSSRSRSKLAENSYIYSKQLAHLEGILKIAIKLGENNISQQVAETMLVDLRNTKVFGKNN